MENKSLAAVPDGTSIFVDTNILVYHLLDDEQYGTVCRDFLKRVEARSLRAFVSPLVASETLFIYLRSWVMKNKQIEPKPVLRYLKRHREVIQEVDFSKPQALLTLLRVLSLNKIVLQISYDLMVQHHLLPADALHVALLKHYNLAHLATRDDDFDNVEGVTVFKPFSP